MLSLARRISRTTAFAVLLCVTAACSDSDSIPLADTTSAAESSPSLDAATSAARASADMSPLVLPDPWPTLQPDSLGTRDAWHFVYETAPSKRLLLIHRLADLVLPDGPFELLAPITAVRRMSGTWSQYTPVAGTISLPGPALRAIIAQLTQPDRVYFYQIRALDLTAATDSTTFPVTFTRTMREMEREAVRLRKNGFIGGDAEP